MQLNLRQSNLIYPTMNTLMLSLLQLPNKSFWYDHKITDMPRLPDYLDVVFLSPMCEALTSGHCRKLLLPTTSQNWWNVDQVAHKLHNLCSIMCKWDISFWNSRNPTVLWLVYNHRNHDCFGLWPASGPVSQWQATWFNKEMSNTMVQNYNMIAGLGAFY